MVDGQIKKRTIDIFFFSFKRNNSTTRDMVVELGTEDTTGRNVCMKEYV